jgi:hypothetical protein
MWYTCDRTEKCTRFWWESPQEGDHLKDQGIDGRMGLEGILGTLAGGGGLDWIRLTQDRDQWQSVVNVVMNFRF